MLLYNGKKPGGYSIESYEPTDTLPEEEIQNNNFIKMAFTKKISSRKNNSLDTSKIYNYNTFYNNLNNMTYSRNVLNMGQINSINPIKSLQLNQLNSINPYQTISSFSQNSQKPFIYQYSTKSKYVFQPLIAKNLINYGNLKVVPKMNYMNFTQPQPMHRSRTLTFISPIKHNPLANPYIINTNPVLMPVNIVQPQNRIVPKYNLNINKILPIYPPTITYHRRY